MMQRFARSAHRPWGNCPKALPLSRWSSRWPNTKVCDASVVVRQGGDEATREQARSQAGEALARDVGIVRPDACLLVSCKGAREAICRKRRKERRHGTGELVRSVARQPGLRACRRPGHARERVVMAADALRRGSEGRVRGWTAAALSMENG